MYVGLTRQRWRVGSLQPTLRTPEWVAEELQIA